MDEFTATDTGPCDTCGWDTDLDDTGRCADCQEVWARNAQPMNL